MNNSKLIISFYLLILPFFLSAQQVSEEKASNNSWIQHPWQGKRVGFIGDSLTDPNSYGDKIRKYWSFLQEWLDITPYVYGVSGRQWDNVPAQAQQLYNDHGSNVDAILVFMGTNDFNHGVPIGEWYSESIEKVMTAQGEPKKMVDRKRRTLIMDKNTYRGRINIGIAQLKKLFPDKQIVLLTPLHRSFADFGEKNVQPDETYQNRCGEYVDAYIQEIKNAGNI
ncbi:MAG: SGNH/GDSL hydrolase family protein, partial [Dysgonomonas sp.]